MPGGEELYEEFDDGIFESLAIVALAAALAVLVVYRRRRAEERERLQRQQGNVAAGGVEVQQAQPGGAGGLYPQPGDPEGMAWAAGGVGH